MESEKLINKYRKAIYKDYLKGVDFKFLAFKYGVTEGDILDLIEKIKHKIIKLK